jgi:hypothetical protein
MLELRHYNATAADPESQIQFYDSKEIAVNFIGGGK